MRSRRLCGRLQNGDDHAVNHHVFDGMRFRAAYDQAVSALIEEICERGLDARMLVVVAGSFGGRRRSITSQVVVSGTQVPQGATSGLAGTIGREHFRTSGLMEGTPPSAKNLSS
ncbi:hypothetical protein FF011L_27060 [Roseimaritima multifibrata]|uniref:Uncharacterized protein n=1 Tax=Roseimaritima multifibrata TaxID=1930274 RepID=A0A517MGD0_9BACT|nr:DUF1501 domain-containing protein [Roseimaritima multifibrata]QDS93929.1 hypothetical protein FF011L_27060 [Roseimaritima multifibrata]